MTSCKYCNKKFENLTISQKANHSRWCKLNPKYNIYVNGLNYVRSTITPEQRKKQANTLSKSYKEKRIKVHSPSYKGKTHSEKTKIQMSNKRKQYLLENPEKHPWRKNTKFISIPCEYLKDILKKNKITFEEEYQPLFPNRYFSIDIAFPELKLGIEVNGNQHYYKNKTLKPYYQNRHNLIENEGWKIIELHYLEVYNDNILNIIKCVL